MVSQRREPFGIQFVDSPSTLAAVAHQPSMFQHAQVLRDRRPRHRQTCSEFVYGSRMRTDHLEDGEPGGITQSRQAVLYVSFHLP